MGKGKIQLVGAGPGDPELITLKGLKAIQNAEVILYDALINPKLLDYNSKALKVFVKEEELRTKHKTRSMRYWSALPLKTRGLFD